MHEDVINLEYPSEEKKTHKLYIVQILNENYETIFEIKAERCIFSKSIIFTGNT